MPAADLTRIASNIGAMNALDSLRRVNSHLSVAQLRLSTGKRINSAADDPAGYFIANTLNARTEGMKVALDNIGDGKNVLSIAEGGLQKISDILLQMRSKTEQAGSTTLNSAQRDAIGTQLDQYLTEISNIVAQTSFNNISLLGNVATHLASTALKFQVGPGTTLDVDQLTFLVANGANAFDAEGLGLVGAGTAAAIVNDAGAPAAGGEPDTNVVQSFSASAVATGYSALADGRHYLETQGTHAGGDLKFRLVDNSGVAVQIQNFGGVGLTSGWQTFVQGTTYDTGRGLSFLTVADDATVTAQSAGGSTSHAIYKGAKPVGGAAAAGTDGAALTYMGLIDTAATSVASALATVGAYQARLAFKEDFLMVSVASNEASYNRIMNADMAQEQVNATKFSILQQVATAMLTQANAAPQSSLALFR
jgi:flagellin